MLMKNWLEGSYDCMRSLGADAQDYIETTKNSPSRMVGAHAGTNLCSFIPSKKMGCTISTESFSAEGAFAKLCEYDSEIKAYYDQPQPIPISKFDKNGKQRKISYTPDFLIETRSGFYVVEVKHEDRLNKLCEKEPKNWVQKSGYYEYSPAKDAFCKLGLRHVVWAYKPSYRYKVANISLLMATSESSSEIDKSLLKDIAEIFEESFYCSLYELREMTCRSNYSELIQLIDSKHLYANIDDTLLSEPRSCIVVQDPSLLDTAVTLDKKQKLNLGFKSDTSVASVPTEKEAKKVLVRLQRLNSGEKSRSTRRWRKKIEESGLNSDFEALIDQSFKSGNRTQRINIKVLDYLNHHITSVHSKNQGLSRYRSYIRYCVNAEKHHPSFPYVSFKTFLKHLKKYDSSDIAFKRAGRRARNGLLEPTNPLDRNLKFQLPWEAAAIDEYLADIYLVFYTADNQPYVARPWITAMIDLSTSKVLALSISFKNPSKRSLAKVIRECVRNHGKLPREILFDRGSNFKSVYAAELLAFLGITNTMRPAAYSRSGGEIEALFVEFIRQWLSQRPGNLADYKEARSVDGKLAPKNKAVLKPIDFNRELKLFSNWRDAKPVGFGDMAREDKFHMGANNYPFIGLEIPYDERFLIATAVESGKYRIDPQRGIHIGAFHYWNPELSGVSRASKKVEVRIDPENPHVVYSLVNNNWIPCYSSQINRFNALNFESQFIEGLIALETTHLKSTLKHQADKNLVNIIDSLDAPSSNDDQFKYVELRSTGSEGVETDSIINLFDEIKNMEVKSLKSGSW